MDSRLRSMKHRLLEAYVKPANLLLAVILILSACETTRATQYVTPKDRVTECEKVCGDVGMKLGALVVIMSSAGCVCEPMDVPTSSERKAAAGAAGGGTTITAAAAAAAAATIPAATE